MTTYFETTKDEEAFDLQKANKDKSNQELSLRSTKTDKLPLSEFLRQLLNKNENKETYKKAKHIHNVIPENKAYHSANNLIISTNLGRPNYQATKKEYYDMLSSQIKSLLNDQLNEYPDNLLITYESIQANFLVRPENIYEYHSLLKYLWTYNLILPAEYIWSYNINVRPAYYKKITDYDIEFLLLYCIGEENVYREDLCDSISYLELLVSLYVCPEIMLDSIGNFNNVLTKSALQDYLNFMYAIQEIVRNDFGSDRKLNYKRNTLIATKLKETLVSRRYTFKQTLDYILSIVTDFYSLH